MKLVGEKSVSPFLVELEKDAIKMTKIRECCEKAVMAVKLPKTKKDRPSTAPVKSAAPTATVAKTPASSTSKRPTTGIVTISVLRIFTILHHSSTSEDLTVIHELPTLSVYMLTDMCSANFM